MKNTLLTLTSMLALGSAAYAGTETTYTSTQAPAPSGPLYEWFAGVSYGHLDDADEGIVHVHLGKKFAENGPASHSWYLEVGYLSTDNFLVDVDLVPVTLNYKFDYYFTDRLSWYIGAGAGAGFIDVKTPFGSDDSVEFAVQAVTGLGYDITPNFQVYGGARWLWVDDTTVFGIPADVGDDIGAEIGLRFRF